MHRWSSASWGLVGRAGDRGLGSVSSNADGGGGSGGTCAFATTYTIRDVVGLAPTADTATLMPPNSFRYERISVGTDAALSCTPALPAASIRRASTSATSRPAIAHTDVQAALALATPPTYGERAVSDGPNFNFMRTDGRGFNAGLDCDHAVDDLHAIPARVSALIELLSGLIRQQRMDPTCSAITGN